MPESIALASGLAELESRLRAAHDEADVAQVLRALQRLGLSETDLCVHIERLRAHNDAREQSEHVEENCLRALDLTTGYAAAGLQWDPATMAPILLGAVLDREALEAAFTHAVRPNDLLPPRPYNRLSEDVASRLINWVEATLRHDDYQVGPAELFRTPKSPFTTRPAALLALPDRLALEALADLIKERLDEMLPTGVLWPRGRAPDHANGAIVAYRSQPLEWNSTYVVKADIADFYGSVDHAILGLITSTHLAMPTKYGQAIESLLSALMAIDRGLPQGVPASDIFASTLLLPVDSRLSRAGETFIRYSDDYLLPADSLDEARSLLHHLEADLRGIGLALNDDKTAIMKSSTYRKGLTDHADALGDLVNQLKTSHHAVLQLHESDWWDSHESDLDDAKASPFWGVVDPLWEHIYLDDLTITEVVEDLSGSIECQLVQIHEALLRALVLELESETPREKKADYLGRQCLIFLAAAQSKVSLDDIDVLLQWFPKLAPHVSIYLSSIAENASGEISRFLVRALDRQPKSDWTTGWLCAAVDRPGVRLSRELKSRLMRVANYKDEGLLTRTSAIRALAVAGELTEATWRNLHADATPAVRSEMAFSALFEEALYPWPFQPFEPSEAKLALGRLSELEDPRVTPS